MRFSLFNPWPVYDVDRPGRWPVPPQSSTPDGTRLGMRRGFEISMLADQVGFDYVTLAEHHYHPRQLSPNPLVSGAALSQHLTRAGLTILGCTLPLVNPIRAAEEIAVLDAMTDGNLIVGLFRGTPNEYLTYGTNPGETRDMFEEAVALVRQAWTQPEPFSWVGRHYDYRVVSVWPRPVTRPHPPILVSAGSPSSAAYAAANRFRIGIAFAPPEVAAHLVDFFRSEAAAHGWTPRPEEILYRGFVVVADTDEKAREIAARCSYGDRPAFVASDFGVNEALVAAMAAQSQTAQSPGTAQSPVAGRPAVPGATPVGRPPGAGGKPGSRLHFVGSPDTVARQVREFAERTGVGHFDLLFNDVVMPFEDAMHGVRLFGTEVLPQLTGAYQTA